MTPFTSIPQRRTALNFNDESDGLTSIRPGKGRSLSNPIQSKTNAAARNSQNLAKNLSNQPKLSLGKTQSLQLSGPSLSSDGKQVNVFESTLDQLDQTIGKLGTQEFSYRNLPSFDEPASITRDDVEHVVNTRFRSVEEAINASPLLSPEKKEEAVKHLKNQRKLVYFNQEITPIDRAKQVVETLGTMEHDLITFIQKKGLYRESSGEEKRDWNDYITPTIERTFCEPPVNQDNNFSQDKPFVCTPKVELKEGCGLRQDVECDTYTTGERICTIKIRPEDLRFMEGHMKDEKYKQKVLNAYSEDSLKEHSRDHFATMRARRKEVEEYEKQQEESNQTSTQKVAHPPYESVSSIIDALKKMNPN